MILVAALLLAQSHTSGCVVKNDGTMLCPPPLSGKSITPDCVDRPCEASPEAVRKFLARDLLPAKDCYVDSNYRLHCEGEPPPATVKETATVQLLAIPIPMETVRERLDIKRSPVGLWNFAISNDTDQPAIVSREKLQILIASWCEAHKAPMPLILTKEQAWPIIARKSGGRWKTVQRLVTYASLGIAISGVPIAAAAGTVLELVSGGAGQRIPDISALTAELPAVITIPSRSGVTLSAWSSKMATRPQVIGPVLVR